MILLVHSCDGREVFLNYWIKCFKRSGWDIPVRYIVGKEKFTDQLYRVLSEIDDEYIWHILDDYFVVKTLDWEYYYNLAIGKDALRIQPNVSFNSLPYRFRFENELLRQVNSSAYQISFASSIWRRRFLIDCLTPGLDPWQQENSTKINAWNHKIYFVPELPFWYINGTIKGMLTERGKEVINDFKLRESN